MTRDQSVALMTTKGGQRTGNRTPYVDEIRFASQDGGGFGEDVESLLLSQPAFLEEMLFHKVDVGDHILVAWWAVLSDEELVIGRCPRDRLCNLYIQACNRKGWSMILRWSCRWVMLEVGVMRD